MHTVIFKSNYKKIALYSALFLLLAFLLSIATTLTAKAATNFVYTSGPEILPTIRTKGGIKGCNGQWYALDREKIGKKNDSAFGRCLGAITDGSGNLGTKSVLIIFRLNSAIKKPTIVLKDGKGVTIPGGFSYLAYGGKHYLVSVNSIAAAPTNCTSYIQHNLAPGDRMPSFAESPQNRIRGTITGNKGEKETIDIDACSQMGVKDYNQPANDSNVFVGADLPNLKTGDDGKTSTVTPTTGTIQGHFGVLMPDTNTSESGLTWNEVTKITLEGPSPHSYDVNSSSGATTSPVNTGWLNLTEKEALKASLLEIPNLKPGSYTLKILYNCALRQFCPYGTTTAEFSKSIRVTARDEPFWITDSSTTVYRFGASGDGEIVKTQLEDGEEEVDPTTCVIDGIGWIICPVINFMANIVDAAYAFVSSLLVIQPLMTTGDTAGVYNAWKIMRNIANVAFVVAFIIIIFSQLTSVGITNYGIKKMLPRLIVAAILVNASYWICAIAVDLSNVLGASMRNVFNSALPTGTNTSVIADGEGWLGTAGFILAGAAGIGVILYIGLSALIPALLAALLAIVTVFLVLTLRQALVILLIVVSPLAFVAFLLPNTEDLFKKWKGLLQTLLLMYPIIGGIFGASALASAIVTTSASGDYKVAIQIMGALIAILPLALTPIVMKSAGGLLNRFGGIVNNPNKGPFDRMKKGADNLRERRQNSRAANALTGKRVFGGGQFRRATRRKYADKAAQDAAAMGEAAFSLTDAKTAQYAQNSANSQLATNAINTARSNQLAANLATNGGGAIQAAMGSKAASEAGVDKAIAAQVAKATADAIKDAELSIKSGDLKSMASALEAALAKGDSITARALQNKMLTSGAPGIDAYRKAYSAAESRGVDTNVTSAMSSNILDNHAGIKSSAADIMQHAANGGTLDSVGKSPDTWSKLSDTEVSQQKPASLSIAIASGGISQAQATRILENPDLAQTLSPDARTQLEEHATAP